MLDVESRNLRQIEMLNQRGGRALSIVDLMRAGTLPPEMAAFAFRAILDGASLLTAARPGGAGKTTLMASLLGLLPAGEKLRTVGAGASRVPRGRNDHGRECLLCHEIGNGQYFGYLWGREAGAFLEAAARGVRIASNLHADTLEEVYSELTQPEFSLGADALRSVNLIFFMAIRPSFRGSVRRVSAVYGSLGGEHRLLWEWDETSDTFRWVGPGRPEEITTGAGIAHDRALALMRELRESGPTDFTAVRRRALDLPTG